MARIDEDPDERDTKRLQISRLIDCPECDTTFDHVFLAPEGIFEVEDLVDAPTDEVECPSCQHKWTAECEIWMAHEDAG